MLELTLPQATARLGVNRVHFVLHCQYICAPTWIVIMFKEFENQAREVLQRLRSPEGDTLNQVDLALLRIQLQLLDEELAKRQYRPTHEAS